MMNNNDTTAEKITGSAVRGRCTSRKEAPGKKRFGILIALSALAVALLLGSMACSLFFKETQPTIMWIDLYGPVPVAATPTAETLGATISLDFNKPIPELNVALASNKLNEIFTFVYYKDGTSRVGADIRATSIAPEKIGAGNVYNLDVAGVPKEGGTVEVTIQTVAVEPAIRIWHLDGSHALAATKSFTE
jgi:hypothetical protein